MPYISSIAVLLAPCASSAFVLPTSNQPSSFLQLSVSSVDTPDSGALEGTVIDNAKHDQRWASHALLISSLGDGVVPNTAARSFLRYSIVNSLLCEQISQNEQKLEESVKFSPCNGPNIEALSGLESVDQIYKLGQKISAEDFDASACEKVDSWAKDALKRLSSGTDLNVKVLYIPTAMYALNPSSSNTPGKQRQRARADGKKRRTTLLNLLGELLTSNDDEDSCSGPNLLGITLDLDDGSLKQPVGSEDASLFPENDKAALSTWNPHLIYVEGGNTFWLKYCIDKGDYTTLIKDAICTGGSAGAVYCGKSAGAIVAGGNVVTATWKGWDDPSVVPEMETYDKWLGHPGFDLVGGRSFFPHMSDDWEDLVKEKLESQSIDNVHCLREEDAYCVLGEKKASFLASGPRPIN